MNIYVVGTSKNNYLKLDNIRTKYFVDVKHNEDNIDYVNPWYCELTGLYHMWKNCSDDIIGLEHYRRYFINDNGYLLNENDINNILLNNDIIMYKYIGTNALNDMTNTGKRTELALALSLVNIYYGKDMANFFKTKLCLTDYVYEGNMFVCRKELLNEYATFLFDILYKFDIEHKFKKPRINGYIAEYFFGPWMEYNNKKIYNCRRQTFDKTVTKKLYGHI